MPLVSIVVPAYNEALILENHLEILCLSMERLEDSYRWELILVNDGSQDGTGDIADAFAHIKDNIHVVHHSVNRGLGQALRTGFTHCCGKYIVVLDLDLSYSPSHIRQLLNQIQRTGAKIVVASPYAKGGRVSNVPWLRRSLSVWANRFLSFAAKRNVSTLTGMVRAYDADFLKLLNLKSSGMEINPEIIHKAMLLDARIDEIPAHLNWQVQRPTRNCKPKRKSSMKVLRHTWATFYYGFVFRPVMFFVIPSLVFFFLSLYVNIFALIRCWISYRQLAQKARFPDPTEAVAIAFREAPHTFILGGVLLMLAIQLFSLGILAVQNKRYFEEIFSLGTATYKSTLSQRFRD
jgi:glycosyltransferase involved in cell wall biosynthesis